MIPADFTRTKNYFCSESCILQLNFDRIPALVIPVRLHRTIIFQILTTHHFISSPLLTALDCKNSRLSGFTNESDNATF